MVIALSSRGRFIAAAAAAVLCYLLLLLLLLCMPSLLLPSVTAAAAGEILGELQQRFMSLPPAGGLRRLSCVSEAHTGEDRLGNGHTATAVDFHKIIQRKYCLNGCKFGPK